MEKYEKFTAEQEREFIGAIQAQGGEPNEQQQKRLAAAYLPFLKTVAYKLGKSYKIEPDELLGAAWCGMIHAIKEYDLEGGTRFLSFAVWWVRCFVNKERERILGWRQYQKDGGSFQSIVSLDKPIKGEPDGAALLDLIADPNSQEQFTQVINAGTIEQIKGTLNKRLFEALFYSANLDGGRGGIAGAADIMGVSKERARQLKERALDVVRRRLIRAGEIPGEIVEEPHPIFKPIKRTEKPRPVFKPMEPQKPAGGRLAKSEAPTKIYKPWEKRKLRELTKALARGK